MSTSIPPLELAVTNLTKAEDAAHSSTDPGIVLLAVRRDTAASSSGTDGDYSTINVDSLGNLYVTVKPGIYSIDDSAMPATPNMTPVGGEYRASPTTYTDGDATVLQTDVNGALKTSLATLIAGEDLTNNVLKTEQRFSYTQVTSDTAVKSAAGFLHTLTFAQTDAAPTAGTIDVYDNTAGSGTKIFSWTLTTTVFMPFTLIFDCSFGTGLYIDFTTTADVAVSCAYR